MRLPVIHTNVPTTKQSFNLKNTTITMLDQYAEFYKQTTGVEIQRKDLVEQMILTFARDDKDFQKFIKTPAQAEI